MSDADSTRMMAMTQLRWDPIKNTWTVFTDDARRRLAPLRPPSSHCPFCEGHEEMCAGELYAARPPGSPPNGQGWRVRVVPNHYPVFRVEGTLERRGEGLYDVMNGIGAHEIIIETPSHDKTLSELSGSEIADVLRAYRARLLDLSRDLRLRYLLICKNQGLEAGAVLSHAHSQLIALPIIPAALRKEFSACRNYFLRKERCLKCDLLAQEIADGRRIVSDDGLFVTYVPYAASRPFELRIVPRRHAHNFTTLNEEELCALAEQLKQGLGRLRTALRDPPFNLVLHTSPPPHPRPGYPQDWQSLPHDFHWHLEITPRLITSDSFEWGAGLHLNPVPPEEAASFLRSVSEPTA